MVLLVPPQPEEQFIPSRAALLEQVKNIQPILDGASIQGMHVLLQVWAAHATPQAVAYPVFFFFFLSLRLEEKTAKRTTQCE